MAFTAHIPRKSVNRQRTLGEVAAFGSALMLHALILLLVLTWRAPALVSGPFGGEGSLFSVPGTFTARVLLVAQPKSVRPSPPKLPVTTKTSVVVKVANDLDAKIKLRPLFNPPSDVTPILVDVDIGGPPPSDVPPIAPSPAAALAFAAASAGGKSCQILDVLQTLLQTSEEVRTALPLIPMRSRSVANAVMLWDGKWVDASTLGGLAAVGPIQTTVLQTISAAPPGCQAELVRGPRLISIGDARDTIVLAFGSGEWRWGDLLVSPPVTQFASVGGL